MRCVVTASAPSPRKRLNLLRRQRMLKLTMTAAAVSALILLPARAQARQLDSTTTLQLAQKTPSEPAREGIRNQKLADAASINEDLIGFALEGKADKVAE